MTQNSVIVWLRRDLRLRDNPALDHAARTGAAVLPVFILEDDDPWPVGWPVGGASRWWLHHSLISLSNSLAKKNSALILRRGTASTIIPDLAKQTGARMVTWNRRYFHPHIDTDKDLKTQLQEAGIEVKSFNANSLREPWEVKTGSGSNYKVFTPFWKAVKSIGPARADIVPAPRSLKAPDHWPQSDKLDDWSLAPSTPDWAEKFPERWQPGEAQAKKLLSHFLKGPVQTYDDDRNRPDLYGTSRLSPHLAWGEISPLQIWRATHQAIDDGTAPADQAYKFLSEVVWREFATSLLYFYPDLPEKPLKSEFSTFPWADNKKALKKWQQGQTGYPIVDAGMRELWQTGWMHNRVRMITASFLIKHLLIPWQEGEKWFWDTLVDADMGNNAASWQWVAGSGADAAPYFRIFNPITQGEKFDPNGEYVRTYVPELAKLPQKFIHKPWEAPLLVLSEAGVALGETYPEPIVDHSQARKKALAGYDDIRGR